MARKAAKKVSAKQYADIATGIRLSSHEKLCAERMKTLNDSINELKKEVKSLRQDVLKGKGAISVLVFLGTVVAGVIGFFQFK
jgi:cob(I)alamin adenosyltransferase